MDSDKTNQNTGSSDNTSTVTEAPNNTPVNTLQSISGADKPGGAGPSEKSSNSAIGLISYDDFSKVALRIGVVETAEKIEKSEKLLKLAVNLGEPEGPRQIIAGIAKKYEPATLIGKRIVVVANLKPAKLMGHLSQGMLLAASNEAGDLELVSVSDIFQGGSIVR